MCQPPYLPPCSHSQQRSHWPPGVAEAIQDSHLRSLSEMQHLLVLPLLQRPFAEVQRHLHHCSTTFSAWPLLQLLLAPITASAIIAVVNAAAVVVLVPSITPAITFAIPTFVS